MPRSFSDDEEVNDPGGEVQRYVFFTVDHCDAVSVPVTGPRHTTTEQQERRPVCSAKTHKESSIWSKSENKDLC